MVTSRREFLRYLAVGSAAAALSACAPKAEPTAVPAAPAAPAAEKPAAPAAAPAAPAGDKVVLQQWYHEYGEAGCQEAVNRIAKEYSDMQDKVTIEVGWFPGDYETKLNSALAAGDAPDLFENKVRLEYVRNNYIVCLDDVITQEEKDDFLPAAISFGSIKGKYYAATVVADFQGLYLRKSMLEKAGFGDVAIEDWTWKKVYEAGVACTEGRQKGLFLGNDGGQGITKNYMLPSAGVWPLNPETSELVFDTEIMTQVFEEYLEYFNQDIFLQGAPMDWWDPSAFNQGLAAIQWGGCWQGPGTNAVVPDDFFMMISPKYGAGFTDEKRYTGYGGWVEMVSTKSADVEEATKYLHWQWIENIDWQNEYSTGYGFHIPARAAARAANEKVSGGFAADFFAQAAEFAIEPNKLWVGAVTTPWNDACTNIFSNGADIKSSLDQAYELVSKELESQLKYMDELPGA